MKTPEGVVISSKEIEKAYELIDNFFESIKREVKERFQQEENDFKIRLGGAFYAPGAYTGDIIHQLQYKEKIIAVVTETRTESEHTRLDFFQNLESIIKQSD